MRISSLLTPFLAISAARDACPSPMPSSHPTCPADLIIPGLALPIFTNFCPNPDYTMNTTLSEEVEVLQTKENPEFLESTELKVLSISFSIFICLFIPYSFMSDNPKVQLQKINKNLAESFTSLNNALSKYNLINELINTADSNTSIKDFNSAQKKLKKELNIANRRLWENEDIALALMYTLIQNPTWERVPIFSENTDLQGRLRDLIQRAQNLLEKNPDQTAPEQQVVIT